MMMKKIISKVARELNYSISPVIPRRFGKDPLSDMKTFIHTDCPVVFDVGANIGQSVRRFRSRFPKCIVHSFEPSPTTFEKLNQRVSRYTDVHTWNCGLGATSTQMTFLENENSDMSSFLPLSKASWGQIVQTSSVQVKTIDQFCQEQQIDHIDILKSDTQGFDLEVLRGAEETIQANKIGLVYLEIIFSDMYKDLPQFTEIYEHLITRNFLLVSFYQFHHQNHLASWTDCLFVHKSYLSK